jgi:hypothetical protein
MRQRDDDPCDEFSIEVDCDDRRDHKGAAGCIEVEDARKDEDAGGRKAQR